MATYANNTTTKVGNTVSIWYDGGSTIQTYTVPAGSMLEASFVTVTRDNTSSSTFRVTYPGAPKQTVLSVGFGSPNPSETLEKIKYPAGSILEFQVVSVFSETPSFQLVGFLTTNTP